MKVFVCVEKLSNQLFQTKDSSISQGWEQKVSLVNNFIHSLLILRQWKLSFGNFTASLNAAVIPLYYSNVMNNIKCQICLCKSKHFHINIFYFSFAGTTWYIHFYWIKMHCQQFPNLFMHTHSFKGVFGIWNPSHYM